MIGKVIGALVGREIDRRDGEGGIKGSVLGAAAVPVIRRLGTLGVLSGGVFLAKRAFDRRKGAKAGVAAAE